MRVINYNNRNCLDWKDENGNIPPLQILFVSESGGGKGCSSDGSAESWKRATGGCVISANDPKLEAEHSFVQYDAQETYHLKELRIDGKKKGHHKAILYHPYTHNLSKRGYLPCFVPYTLSIKDMTKQDWSILAETDAESEAVKLLERVAEDLERNGSLFDFLHEIQRLSESNKNKSDPKPDPKNWLLKSGGGTYKSVRQIGNMLSPFKKHYFLRKDTCPYKLNWEEILLNPEPYHVFLTNFIDNPKLRNFLVVCLMGQAVSEAQRLANLGKLKHPILFVLPELVKVCPAESKGSALYLAKSLREHLVTMRSKAKGMSCIGDTQIWCQTAPEIVGAFNETFFGKLNPEDARIIFKAKSYTSRQRQLFEEIQENIGCFVWNGHEDYGVFKFLMPSHSHKEVKYNWIQMWKKHKLPLKKYDSMVREMKIEYSEEYNKINSKIKDEQKKVEIEKLEKKEIKHDPNKLDKKTNPKETKDIAKEYLYKRSHELHEEGLSDRKIADELGVKSHKTAKNYYLKYEKILEENKPTQEDFKESFGDGILPEEIKYNFGDPMLE